jgi:hypothetical protein
LEKTVFQISPKRKETKVGKNQSVNKALISGEGNNGIATTKQEQHQATVVGRNSWLGVCGAPALQPSGTLYRATAGVVRHCAGAPTFWPHSLTHPPVVTVY